MGVDDSRWVEDQADEGGVPKGNRRYQEGSVGSVSQDIFYWKINLCQESDLRAAISIPLKGLENNKPASICATPTARNKMNSPSKQRLCNGEAYDRRGENSVSRGRIAA